MIDFDKYNVPSWAVELVESTGMLVKSVEPASHCAGAVRFIEYRVQISDNREQELSEFLTENFQEMLKQYIHQRYISRNYSTTYRG